MSAEKIVKWPGKTAGHIEFGTVNGESEDGLTVHGPSGTFMAKVAFSCHVRPIAGDKVMYTRDPESGCYILAILERLTGTDTVLSFPGDVKVESANGLVNIAARAGIDLTTGSAVTLTASDINVSAAQGRFTVLDMQAAGESFSGSLKKMQLISDTIDVVAQRLTHRLKSSYRWIEEIEHTAAGQMLHRVRNLFSVRSRHSTITAEQDVKINGERVHLG